MAGHGGPNGNRASNGNQTRPGAGRKRGSKSKRTLARRLAEAEAMRALPEQFQGNALALLQAVYRNTANELRVRIDAAGKTLPFEMARPEASRPAEQGFVPLHERIQAAGAFAVMLNRHSRISSRSWSSLRRTAAFRPCSRLHLRSTS
jgi:hypothetical protein